MGHIHLFHYKPPNNMQSALQTPLKNTIFTLIYVPVGIPADTAGSYHCPGPSRSTDPARTGSSCRTADCTSPDRSA